MEEHVEIQSRTGRRCCQGKVKEKVEEKFEGSKIVYGDTDSIFINFNPPSNGREGVKESIDMGIKAEEFIQQFLKPPHKLEYEKFRRVVEYMRTTTYSEEKLIEGRRDFVAWFQEHDIRRQTNFAQTFPDLKDVF